MTNEEEMEEFEVVELQSEEGDVEEFVIIDELVVEEKTYAILAPLEAMEDQQNLSEEEFQEHYGDGDYFLIMRKEGEYFEELTDEEYELLRDELDQRVEATEDSEEKT